MMYKFVLAIALAQGGIERPLSVVETPAVFESHEDCMTALNSLQHTDLIIRESDGVYEVKMQGACLDKMTAEDLKDEALGDGL